jgi:hypothetical protein
VNTGITLTEVKIFVIELVSQPAVGHGSTKVRDRLDVSLKVYYPPSVV